MIAGGILEQLEAMDQAYFWSHQLGSKVSEKHHADTMVENVPSHRWMLLAD